MINHILTPPVGTWYVNILTPRGLALLKQMKEAVNSVQEKLGAKLFDSVTRGVMPGETHLCAYSATS